MKPIIRIHRPELTAEEREKRMERIHNAAAALVMAAQKNNAQKG